jgi:hypothetical protein
MRRKIVEVAIVIGSLTILKAFELNLAWVLLFRRLDALARFGYVARIDCVEYIELQSPHHICCILDIPTLLETLEGNRLRVVRPIETADDNKGSIRFALKFLEFTNGVVDTELC